jgi:Uma2 family endonuclease
VPDIIVSLPVNCSQRGVDGTAELVVELRSPGDESYEKLPWYAARGVTEVLIVDPTTRRFELYRSHDGAADAVTADDDGGVTLDTLGVRLLTVPSDDGPRLRVTTDAETTDC